MQFLLTVSLIIIATMTVVPAHRNLLADDVHSVRSLSGAVFDPYTPIFTDSTKKLAETDGPPFTFKLIANAVNYEPLLTTPNTQMHLGFWSGPGNHGSLVRLLNSINNDINNGCLATESRPNCAVWDEGANFITAISFLCQDA